MKPFRKKGKKINPFSRYEQYTTMFPFRQVEMQKKFALYMILVYHNSKVQTRPRLRRKVFKYENGYYRRGSFGARLRNQAQTEYSERARHRAGAT